MIKNKIAILRQKRIETQEKIIASKKAGMTWADFIVKGRHYIEIFFVIIVLICAICGSFVKVNYDMTEYLPSDAESKQAIDIMEEEFGYPGTARVMLVDVTVYEAQLYKQMIEDVEGVDMVNWMGSDVYMTEDFIDAQDQDDYYYDNCAVFDVTFEKGDSDELTKAAIAQIKDITGEKGRYAGPAVETKSLAETLSSEINMIMVLAVILIFLILCVTMTSWAEPVLFLSVMGIALLLNRGTNLLFGTISFLSNSVAAVLQLAVSMDYSIFLFHSFVHLKEKGMETEKAMSEALKDSALSILSSGMTTFVGFLALVLMRFRIGQDIGFVLAKSIVCSIFTIMFLMPALILRFYGWIEKTRHRSFMPGFQKVSKLIYKLRYAIVVFFIIVAIPSFVMQNMNSYTFGNSSLGVSEGTQVYNDTKEIEAKFGRSNLYLIMVPNGSPIVEKELADTLDEQYYVKSVTSLANMIPDGVPERIVPANITSLLRSDNYARMLVYTKTATESDLAFETSSEIRQIVEQYYPENAYVVGATPSTQDIKDVCMKDSLKINFMSLAAVGIVVGISFKSIVLPIIVLIPISIATFLNMASLYIEGQTTMFMAYLMVSCIQLGATVDYSILLTNNYLTYRMEEDTDKKQAAVKALKNSLLSILTSGSILTIAGYCVYFVSSVSAIKDIGKMIGFGAILSICMVVLGIPGLLTFLDGLVFAERRGMAKIASVIARDDFEAVMPSEIHERVRKKLEIRIQRRKARIEGRIKKRKEQVHDLLAKGKNQNTTADKGDISKEDGKDEK